MKFKIARVLLFLSLSSVFCTAKVYAHAQPMTLKEAAAFALENSPGFNSAQKTQAVSDLQYKTAFSKILPSADFSATHGLQNNMSIGGNNALLVSNPAAPWYSSLNIGVTENLYDNGATLTHIKIADLSRDVAAINTLKSRDTLLLNIAIEFYRYSLATILFDVRKQQENILQKQFQTLSNQYQQGFKTKNDFLRLKTQVQRAEIARITSQNAIELSGAELCKLLGVPLLESAFPSFVAVVANREQKIDTLIPSHPPSLEAFYDYRISKIQLESNSRKVNLSERNYLPRVSVTSGVTYTNLNYLKSGVPFGSTDRLSWNALLTLEYNLWDWGIRKRDVAVASLNRDIQENTLNENLLSINAQIKSLMIDLDRFGRNYKLSRDLLALEEESTRNLETQYREGKATYLDLITSLNSLLDAKVQFYTSYFEALQGVVKYRYFEGKIYDTVFEK